MDRKNYRVRFQVYYMHTVGYRDVTTEVRRNLYIMEVEVSANNEVHAMEWGARKAYRMIGKQKRLEFISAEVMEEEV